MASQKLRAIIAVAVTNFLVMLALVPVSAMLPVVAAQFNVDVPTAGWLMTAFLISLTACLLVSGRMGDLFGHREVFLLGAVVYTIAGTAPAFAQQLDLIILLRVLQGIGAAMISGNSLAIVTNSFTPQERGRAIGIAAAFAALGAITGVLASTFIAEHMNWQALFVLNLPVGLFGIWSAWRLAPQPRSVRSIHVDVKGALLLAAALVSFSLALSHLHSGEANFVDGWLYHSGLLAAALAFCGLFALAELRTNAPILDLRCLRNRVFVCSIFANFIMHLTMMSSTFLLPFLTSNGRGFSPMQTAAVLLAMLLGNVPTPPLSGMLYDRTGWQLLAPLSLFAVGVALIAVSILAGSLSFFGLMLATFASGVASGSFQTPNNTIVMSAVSADLRGFAAGMIETSRQLGHTIGVGISAAIMGAALAGANHNNAAAYVVGYQQAIGSIAGLAFLGTLAALVPAYSRWAQDKQARYVAPRV